MEIHESLDPECTDDGPRAQLTDAPHAPDGTESLDAELDAALDDVLRELEPAPEPVPQAAPPSQPPPTVDVEPAPTVTVESSEPLVEAEPAPATSRLLRSPYIVYAVAWLSLAVATVALLWEAEYPPAVLGYRYLLYGGIGLLAMAPVVWLVTWLTSRRVSEDRSGLATRSLLWAASTAAFGALLWWGALTLLDALRLGWL